MVDIGKVRKRYGRDRPSTCGRPSEQCAYSSAESNIVYWCHACGVEGHYQDYEKPVLCDPDVLALCNELETARRRLAEAEKVLAELEWSDGWDYSCGEVIPFTFCPFCCRRRSDGHVSDCRLAAWQKGRTP